MISKHALMLLCMSLVRLAVVGAGYGIIDDMIDLIQYVGVVTSTETQDTTGDQLNFLGEKLQQRKNEEDKIIITLSSTPEDIVVGEVIDLDEKQTEKDCSQCFVGLEDDSGGGLLFSEVLTGVENNPFRNERFYQMFFLLPLNQFFCNYIL